MFKNMSNKLLAATGFDNYGYGEAYQLPKIGYRKDLAKAKTYYLKAIKEGNAAAYQRLIEIAAEQNNLGEKHFYQAVLCEIEHDYKSAKDEYLQAEANDYLVSYPLALVYRKLYDPIAEYECYQKGLKQFDKKTWEYVLFNYESDPRLAYILGQLYEQGERPNPVPQSQEERFKLAIPYYVIAVKMGHTKASSTLIDNARWCDTETLLIVADKYVHNHQVYGKARAQSIVTLYLLIDELSDSPKHQVSKEQLHEAHVKIEGIARAEVECAYQAAQYFASVKKQAKAIEYWLIAAEKKHQPSLKNLEDQLPCLYLTRQVKQLLDLASIYHQCGMQAVAYKIYKQLAEVRQDQNAQKLMEELAIEDADLARQYGHAYEMRGEFNKAVPFYVKAAAQNNSYAKNWLKQTEVNAEAGDGLALYCMGRFIHSGTNRFAALIRAIHQGNSTANQYLRNETWSAEECYSIAQLAHEGQDLRANDELALFFYRKAVSKQHIKAALKLSELYFTCGGSFENTDQAFTYLCQAARLGSIQASNQMEQMVADNNLIASFYWARDYLVPSKRFKEAAYLLIKSSSKHPPAASYLHNETLDAELNFLLAKEFIENSEFIQDFAKAELFCLKAIKAKHVKAAYYLGSLYATQKDEDADCLSHAFHHWMQAALWNDAEAIPALESIAEEVSAEEQYDLSQFFQHHKQNEERACYWYKQAKLNGYILTKNSSQQQKSTNSHFDANPNSLFDQFFNPGF